ncbi:unnamed protein product [Bursaphelenchus okinawaensis]|uniref:Uncharacterized protein n=1 Tax=Bursaphelenchus okinawaensis TaxID=465554 RepID=A0A811KBF1_9BILA|nr:unnamed protein product [Bursaphelenchus okinawaensis]CAG9099163.1 unnamed protein product [Bursaphelenchus okinawaensis]
MGVTAANMEQHFAGWLSKTEEERAQPSGTVTRRERYVLGRPKPVQPESVIGSTDARCQSKKVVKANAVQLQSEGIVRLSGSHREPQNPPRNVQSHRRAQNPPRVAQLNEASGQATQRSGSHREAQNLQNVALLNQIAYQRASVLQLSLKAKKAIELSNKIQNLSEEADGKEQILETIATLRTVLSDIEKMRYLAMEMGEEVANMVDKLNLKGEPDASLSKRLQETSPPEPALNVSNASSDYSLVDYPEDDISEDAMEF